MENLKIIAFEGIDASGKETQAYKLYTSLENNGYKVATTDFPRYNKPIGALIKMYLANEIDLDPMAFHMLLEADRQDFMADIKALDKEGFDFLILDRFTLSNLAFGVAKGIDLDWLRSLQSKIVQPDLTFIMDVTVKTSMERKGAGKDRHETNKVLLSKARKTYNALANRLFREEDMLSYVLDANHLSPDELHSVVIDYVENVFSI